MTELGITPAQAHYVLSRMVGDRKVSRRDVALYLGMMQKEIDELERRLETLRSLREGEEASGPVAAGKRSKAAGASSHKRKRRITAEQKASRQLQGVYMSLLRRIPKSKRAQYQTLAREKDRQAAVDAMKAALGI
jgi:O6-methylguanine-DNA--protein-cysteine methyltransferase